MNHIYIMEKIYEGFEAGPIRPPSESGSLMLRVTRNCPWNKCRFCMLYKGEKFAIRPVEHIKEDIDRVAYFSALVQELVSGGMSALGALRYLDDDLSKNDRMALFMAHNWLSGASETAFLQDANSMLMKPEHLCEVIQYLRKKFPQIKRVTSYGRSKTISAMKDADLKALYDAGLNRVHIGVESGSDRVLTLMRKGVDKQGHIDAGHKVKSADMELSVYYMPGLGGAELSYDHASESADVFNKTNPDFIRIRSLAVLAGSELSEIAASGGFTPLGDIETAGEIRRFLAELKCQKSFVKSDHILNLFQEIEGVVGTNLSEMLAVTERFLNMSADEQLLYIAGRRSLILKSLSELDDPSKRAEAEKMVKGHNVNHENLDEFVKGMISRFI